MANREKQDVLSLIAEQQSISRDTLAEFGSLDNGQLNWKPSPDVWSIGQVFDHLISSSSPFFVQFDRILANENVATVWQKMPVLPNFFGRFLISAVDPQTVRKVKAPGVFKPSTSDIEPDIVAKFVQAQDRLLVTMNSMKDLPIDAIRVTSPIARFVTYSVLDAFTIFAFHNRRHFNQAKRVKGNADFPNIADSIRARAANSI